jgi:hypothetical protein
MSDPVQTGAMAASTPKARKGTPRKRAAARVTARPSKKPPAPVHPLGGRPFRVPEGGCAGQLAVRLSRTERAELDAHAEALSSKTGKDVSASEVVRMALRAMGVISGRGAVAA